MLAAVRRFTLTCIRESYCEHRRNTSNETVIPTSHLG